MNSRCRSIVWCFLVVWAGVFSCAAGEKIRVVTTILPVYCFAKNIAGDLADVSSLLESGVGPHDFQYKASDLSRLKQADIVVLNGLGLESWMQRALESSKPTGRMRLVVEASSGLKSELIYHVTELQLGGDMKKETKVHDHDHGHDMANPHTWLNPRLAMHAVTNILQAFQKADPGNAPRYAENARQYLERLSTLDSELDTALKPLRQKAFVVFHDAFPYFTSRYQLRMVGVIEEVPDVEPTLKYLSNLTKTIRKNGVKVIFAEPQFPVPLAKRIASDTGVRLSELDPLETGRFEPTAYEDGLRQILKTLVNELK
ncbi:MAG: zinc ABC transporter substrate-binding protein [Opitutaceae bacterium]|nr:zinc ABC transporter substrate-binding protein [Verrucomicrobiales bacterium]